MPERYICDDCNVTASERYPDGWLRVWEKSGGKVRDDLLFCSHWCLLRYYTAKAAEIPGSLA